MESVTATIPVLNSLLFLRDSVLKDIPEILGYAPVWPAASCVAFGCQPDCDGDTVVTLRKGTSSHPGLREIFYGQISTPSRRVVVDTVLWEIVLSQKVDSDRTSIAIWANHDLCPDIVEIDNMSE